MLFSLAGERIPYRAQARCYCLPNSVDFRPVRLHVGYPVLMQNRLLCGFILVFLSQGGCSTPLHSSAKLDGASQWDDDSTLDGGFMEGDDSETTATELVWEDADGAFHFDSGFRRTGNEPGQSTNRHYMRTVRSDFVSADWTFQLTFHTSANAPDDIIFIGLGEAVPDSTSFDEPRNSLNFRIHQGTTAFGTGWDVDVMAHDIGHLHWTYSNQAVGYLPGAEGGTFTAQISKSGRQVTFSILDTAIVATIPDIGTAAPFLSTLTSRIFFGNASSAYSFDTLVIEGD